ncbi:MAG: FAD-dependent oxidoreductase [Halioglobus sp.]
MKKSQPRIAIVGAGPAGLSAAWYLRKNGYTNVEIYEKLERVGGKCLSFEYEGKMYDLAAHEMLAGYTDVMAIAKELNVPSEGRQNVLVYDSQYGEYLDILQASKAGGYGLFQIGWASIRYTWKLLTSYRKISRPGSGLAGCPPELLKPIDSWLAEQRLEALRETFLYVMKVQGYGRLDEIPAAYLVKFQGLRNWVSNVLHVLSLIQYWPRVFSNGFQSLWDAVAATMNPHLNSEIEAIHRRPKKGTNIIGIEIQFADGTSEEFDELIITCPMDLPTLEGLGLDIRDQERNLFDKVIYQEFVTTACLTEGLPTGVTATIPVPELMNYSGYIKIHEDSDMNVFFTPATGKDYDQAEVFRRIQEQVASAPEYKGVSPRVIKEHMQHGWQYFPHVSLTNYAAGFYDSVESLQGFSHTFYAGSLLAFETVGNTVAYTHELIDNYFPPIK